MDRSAESLTRPVRWRLFRPTRKEVREGKRRVVRTMRIARAGRERRRNNRMNEGMLHRWGISIVALGVFSLLFKLLDAFFSPGFFTGDAFSTLFLDSFLIREGLLFLWGASYFAGNSYTN